MYFYEQKTKNWSIYEQKEIVYEEVTSPDWVSTIPSNVIEEEEESSETQISI